MERELIATKIYTLTGFDRETCRLISNIFKAYNLPKLRDMPFQALDSRSIYFLNTGIIHFHKWKDQDIDQQKLKVKILTLGIYKPTDFFQLPIPLSHSVNEYKLTAISSSSVLVADYMDIENLADEEKWIMQLYIVLTQHFLQKTFNHLHLLQTPNASDRLKLISKHFGNYLTAIPYQYLASFMGISRKHLSRILKSQPS